MAEFDVVFCPKMIQRYEEVIHVSIVDFKAEKTTIYLVGEGHQDDVTLDNICLRTDIDMRSAEVQLEESASESAIVDRVQFGHCHVGKPYQVTFTITNHSRTHVMRFQWPVLDPFTLSPQIGHLHAGCTKNGVLTLKSSTPITINDQLLKCQVSKIAFQQLAEQVPDWDDCQNTIRWVDVPNSTTNTCLKKEVIEKVPEPPHLTLDESSQMLELHVNATVDFAQYKMETDAVYFKETLLFQTSTFQMELFNTGSVGLEYSWKVAMEESGRAVNFLMDPRPTSTEVDAPSGTSTASPEVQSGRPASQLESTLESFSSYPFPFSVEPRSSTILPGRSQVLQVKFCPQEVGEFEGRLLCSIENLKDGEQGPVVPVKGKGLFVYYHFDLKDSDPDLRGPGGTSLDPGTKVIEFTSIGVHVRNIRSFVIMNPTSAPYSFQWTCQQQEEGQEHKAFICCTDQGHLQPKKTMHITFQFTPQHLDITTSEWNFSINELDISVPFLLVGHTTDPDVSFDRCHMHFHWLLVGHKAQKTVHIINEEGKSYSFCFRDGSRFSEGQINSLEVQPMEGCIPAHSRIPIKIYFMPTLQGEVNFNLICDVKKKIQPLYLNVKAIGHIMGVSVKLEDNDGRVTHLDPKQTKLLQFNEVVANDTAQCKFYILNTGKINFTFCWVFINAKAVECYFDISPPTGVVEVGDEKEILLNFRPMKSCSLNVKLQLLISDGPTFTCALQGVVAAPSLHFSLSKVDFGSCFIYRAGMPIPKRILTITNMDKNCVRIKCLFRNTSDLQLDFGPKELNPKEKTDIIIKFYPQKEASYHETITFEINGFLQEKIEVIGEGVIMKIKVVYPRTKELQFGAVPPGCILKKVATVVNESSAGVTFRLKLESSVPEILESNILTVTPCDEITLKPNGGTCRVEVTFSPKSRILPFRGKVHFEGHGLLHFLFAIKGHSPGIEVKLDKDHVAFGAVVAWSHQDRYVMMQNSSDVTVRFRWEDKLFKPDFSIEPVEGCVRPQKDVKFLVTFHPRELNTDICYKDLPCLIQGVELLKLTLTGSCKDLPQAKEVMKFKCHVRETQCKTIMLSNESNQTWNLRPIIKGEQWDGDTFVRVEAHQQKMPYKITYRPLSMSVHNKKDQGYIVFLLPDWTSLFYLFEGTAMPPRSCGNLTRVVQCHTSYTELLSIANWLNKPQRFHVTVEMCSPRTLEVTTTLKTLEYVEVAASAVKEHELTFFSHKEGTFSARVTFRNESTQEFLFYLVTFKAVQCGPLSTIELTTPVHRRTTSSVKIENPLVHPVTFNIDCNVPDINIPPQFIVPAQSERVLVFEFQPMRPGETIGRLVLNSNDLGYYLYFLVLKATLPRTEKTLSFRTMLGSSQIMIAKFVNYTQERTKYATKIDNPIFHVQETIIAPPGPQAGTEVSVEVTFEPCQLGYSKGTLILSSAIGGNYTIPLRGICVPPNPQGPFKIEVGTTTTISFKNVFNKDMSFKYFVKNPLFTVQAPKTILSKKSADILVSFKGDPSDDRTTVISELVVSCLWVAGPASKVSWVYELEGIFPVK